MNIKPIEVMLKMKEFKTITDRKNEIAEMLDKNFGGFDFNDRLEFLKAEVVELDGALTAVHEIANHEDAEYAYHALRVSSAQLVVNILGLCGGMGLDIESAVDDIMKASVNMRWTKDVTTGEWSFDEAQL